MVQTNFTNSQCMAFAFLLLIGCTGGPPSALEVDSEVDSRKFTKGETLYIRYCADCHGWEGRGDGLAAELLDVQPPPLRRSELFAQNTQEQIVARILHGRERPVALSRDSGPKADTEINALIRYMRRLPFINWEEVHTGQELYDELCIGCHGLYGRGDGDFASNLTVPPRDLTDPSFTTNASKAQLLKVITYGQGAMPGTADVLDHTQRKAVVSFVDLFSPGFETYERFCMVCHGTEGLPIEISYSDESMFEFDLRSIPSFDDDYFEAHTDQQLRPLVMHMLQSTKISMPHFSGILNADQVREIEVYLRNLGPKS